MKVTFKNYVSNNIDQLNHVTMVTWDRDTAHYVVISDIPDECVRYNHLWSIIKIEK